MQEQAIGGVDLHYYALCKRKLWLYKHGITMEQESDRVMEGAILHEQSYGRIETREILIDDAFKIDLIDGDYVREIKLSSRMTNADRLQMLFYLYQLDNRGVKKKGLISYTKERRTEEILLGEEEKQEVAKAIAEVYQVIEKSQPPRLKPLPYCKSCAYYSFCYAGEVQEDDA
ncbi:CRISPR-associated protein Cas4 [Aneurinibacillus sp. REN35]|uniref:CRISPR-associated protein Cas4 n=1 Tax=Aneurinibacillus sp. REN35 TaxID=3237286 RepID=UPI0035279F80